MKDTKEHILKTAFLLFLKNSYKAVTLKNIIEATGLSNGAFYHYFRTKEELYKEIANHFLFRMSGRILESRRLLEAHPTVSMKEYLQHALEDIAYMSNALKEYFFLDETINIYSFMLEAIRIFPEFNEEMSKRQNEELVSWMRIISIAKEKGEIKTELPDDVLARMFVYMPDGCMMAMVYEKPFSLNKRIKTLWEGLYNTIKA